MASVLLLAVGALRPAPAASGPSSAGHVVVARRTEGDAVVHVPGTTLAVVVAPRSVEVRASDGAIVRMPAPFVADVDRVKVRRRGDRYVVMARAGGAWWRIEVDRAGVRTDDSVADRLSRRLPPWAIPAIALCFALDALLLGRALEPLGEIRRLYGAPASERPPRAELRHARARALRLAWGTALTLTPPTALAVAAGALAVVGG